jgi:hypothetical protein
VRDSARELAEAFQPLSLQHLRLLPVFAFEGFPAPTAPGAGFDVWVRVFALRATVIAVASPFKIAERVGIRRQACPRARRRTRGPWSTRCRKARLGVRHDLARILEAPYAGRSVHRLAGGRQPAEPL